MRWVLFAFVLASAGCAGQDANRRDDLFASAAAPQPASENPDQPPSLPVKVLAPELTATDLLRSLHKFAAAKPGESSATDVLAWARRSIAFDLAYVHVSLEAVRTMAADGRGDEATLDGILTRAIGELQHPVPTHLQQVMTQYLLTLAVGAARQPWNDREEIRQGVDEFQKADCSLREATDDERQWGMRQLAVGPTPAEVSAGLRQQVDAIRQRVEAIDRFAVIDCGFGRTLLVGVSGRGSDTRLVPITGT